MGAGTVRPRASEAGFSLVELMVAIVLLGAILVGVAQMSFVLARRTYGMSGTHARDAVIAQQVEQFTALPFDSLKGKAGTITVNKPPLPYQRTVLVDSLSPKWRRVTLVVKPLNPAVRPDTVVLERAKPGGNPFNKP